MRALVTGGAGFIGSHLVDSLVDAGDEVLVLDDLSTGRRENLAEALAQGARMRAADVTDRGAVMEGFRDLEPDCCFHLAAQIDVRRAVADPGFDATVNVLGTINVLEAARERRTPVVFASTGGAIYGEGAQRRLPLDEGAERVPEAPYGMSKLAGEGYLDLYRRMMGVPGVALRLGNVYGPRQDPLGEAGVIAIFCGKLVDGGKPTVYGDGRQTRDYVYVADVVRAFTLAAERMTGDGGAVAGSFNVGTGRETSVLDLVELLSRVGGQGDFAPIRAQRRAGEVERISLDSGKAQRQLGWRAETALEQGLRDTLDATPRGGGRAS
jgi:UDP-glucose 4-epimerase